MNNIIYCQYARKSSEAKEKQVASITDQNLECEKYERENNLLVSYKFEEAKSAYKPHHRLEFDKMMKLFEEKKANGIITWKVDRLARNPEEGGIILQKLQEGIIKEIRTPLGDIYGTDSDHLVLQIHFGMSNQYSRTLSQNVKRGLSHKAQRGEYPFPACTGYEGYGESKSRLIRPHPVEAPIVKELFNLTKTGNYSLSKLCEYAEKSGLKSRRGKKIGKNYIYRILTNPVYYGCFYYLKELFSGSYEPIISKTLFDEVQIALGIRSKSKINNWESSYNGIMHCAICGCVVTTTHKCKYYKRTDNNSIYTYHHCTHRRGNCVQKPITTKELENEFLKNLTLISIDKEVWELALKSFKESNKQEISKQTKYFDQLQIKYKDIQGKISRLIDMRADGEITKDEFLCQKETNINELTRINSLINDNKNSTENWLELAEECINNAFYAQEIFNEGELEEKRELIYQVGENLLLKDEKVIFSFKKPYDILLKPAYRNNGRARWDSNPRSSA